MATLKIYLKDGRRVRRPRYLNLNGTCYVPPTDEQLLEAGYDIKETTAGGNASQEPTTETDSHE